VASRRLLPIEIHKARAEYLPREWLVVSIPLLAMAALHMVAMRVDILMLGFLVESSQVGIYSVATRVAGLSLMGLAAANSIAAPLISENFSRRSTAGLQSTARRAAGLAACISLPIVAGLAVFGRPILGLFGPEFSAGYYALVILLVGQTANVLFGPVGLMMTMTGHQIPATAIFGVALVGNVILNWVLIPIAGIQGAAVATAATTAGWNIAMFVYVFRRLGVKSFSVVRSPGNRI
jgi:O-antigen/teichoic acid export membrane protein